LLKITGLLVIWSASSIVFTEIWLRYTIPRRKREEMMLVDALPWYTKKYTLGPLEMTIRERGRSLGGKLR
jgi:hypothetical protein